MTESPAPGAPHRRRPRYPGRNPRRFDQKYKEHNPARHPETVAKVIASGKTPAGTHRPIMVREILEMLSPAPGHIVVDCTLGHGGHAELFLPLLAPDGRLIGLDVDPIQLPRTQARLRTAGYGPELFSPVRSNFAGLPGVLASLQINTADLILADLGLSSMQIDDPARGFSIKQDGPLDMRMNPSRGQPASTLLERISAAALESLLVTHSDEPFASVLAQGLAGRHFPTTGALARAVRERLPQLTPSESDLTLRRVFQALRIEVNDEFSALDTLLRHLPGCLRPGGRAAILSFHSGEDRRVKKAFSAGLRDGLYSAISPGIIRPSAEERRANPRSTPAKLRWAERAGS